MDTTKIIRGVVSSGRYTVTAPIVKEDYGLYLQIEGVELPSTYEVDFSNSENSGTSVTMIGNADGVLIPHQFIDTGKDIFAFLYHVGEDYGRTVYKFRIPNKVRPDRTEETPTPEEQSVIDQCISALNEAVAQTAQDKADADASAQSASADAERAEEASTDAQNYATQAEQARDDAQTYANNASASATASAQSASQSAQIKSDVEGMVDDAQGYAQASEQSASASANSASQAQGYAQSVSASAQSASGYASSAQTSANTASNKASEASTSAQTASNKASEASQSASQALTYKTDAESAKTASQTAQGLAESARDTAVSAKTDAESARDEAQSIVDGISGALDDKAPVITDTASGAIASFSDGADNLPLKSLVIDIDPVQDLHGQDSPYPAGGGKNKLPNTYTTTTINGVTFTVNSDGTILVNGTATANAFFTLYNADFLRDSPSGSYILNGCPSGGRPSTYNMDVQGASGSDQGSGVFINYTASNFNTSVRIRIYSGYTASNLLFKPMIRLSTVTDATYAPYENICPISGWTSVDVEQSGKNLLDENRFLTETGTRVGGITYNSETGYYEGDIRELYYAFGFNNNPNGLIHGIRASRVCVSARIKSLDESGSSFIAVFKYADGTTESKTIVNYTTSETYGYVASTVNKTVVAVGLSYSSSRRIAIKDFQIELSDTPSDYHPYTGRSITINLGQTVYGGKLDVLSGELTVDRAMFDMGIKDWVYRTNDPIVNVPYFSGNFLDRKPGSFNFICSCYANTRGPRPSLVDKSCATYNSNNSTSICIADSAYTDAATFKAAMAGQTIVYELATPITIQLTPNQINSLLGVNNIWAVSGDTEVEYRADTKLYINKKIAEAISALS